LKAVSIYPPDANVLLVATIIFFVRQVSFVILCSDQKSISCCPGRVKQTLSVLNVPALQEVGTSELIISVKIKILAKRERELITEFAIARNGCWQKFYLQVILLKSGNSLAICDFKK